MSRGDLTRWRLELEKVAGGDLPTKGARAALAGTTLHSYAVYHPDLNTFMSVFLEYKQRRVRSVCRCLCRHVFRSLSLFVRAILLFLWVCTEH